ncbi:MAG TPA: hypothetical protein VFI06_03095 [Chitinophagaceae bacterium]|nr:hypothetical protein [Chitinophagaceae bacterium]
MAKEVTYLIGSVLPGMVNDLKRRGYELEFRREPACIYCIEWQQWIMPVHFSVDESYYFEGTGSPDSDRKLYAITLSQGAKGFLIDSCNVYMDNISREMQEKLETTATTIIKNLIQVVAASEKKPGKPTSVAFW